MDIHSFSIMRKCRLLNNKKCMLCGTAFFEIWMWICINAYPKPSKWSLICLQWNSQLDTNIMLADPVWFLRVAKLVAILDSVVLDMLTLLRKRNERMSRNSNYSNRSFRLFVVMRFCHRIAIVHFNTLI